MDSKSSQALEPYLLLSKSATSPQAACELIVKATSDPATFSYAELLYLPNIQKLAEAVEQYSRCLQLLEIFAFGNLQDYRNLSSQLPGLNPQQVKKLRQLSLLASATIASILPYDQLKISLQLEDDQSLEEFVIDSIYSELIAARLNPAKRLVEVTLVAPVRDVPAAEIKNMVTGLERWEARARMTLSMIENREVGTRAQAAADWARVNKLNQLMGAQAGVGEDGDEIQSPQKPRVRSKEDDAAATLSDLASSSGIWSQSEAMELDSGDIHEMEG